MRKANILVGPIVLYTVLTKGSRLGDLSCARQDGRPARPPFNQAIHSPAVRTARSRGLIAPSFSPPYPQTWVWRAVP